MSRGAIAPQSSHVYRQTLQVTETLADVRRDRRSYLAKYRNPI